MENMVTFEELGFTKKGRETLKRRGISTTEALLSYLPDKYYFFDKTYPLDLSKIQGFIDNKENIAIIGTCTKVENEYKKEKKMSLTKIRVKEKESGKTLYINVLGI